MTPFEVLQKQERRDGPPNWRDAALLRWLELHAYGRQYRLNKGRFLTLNGVRQNTPFEDGHGVRALITGNNLMVLTPFGLRILFDGDQ